MTLPDTETILLNQQDHALFITLNRPKARNAMSLKMVHELMAVFESIQESIDIRAVVLRGAEGHFCAGGDIKDMAGAHMAAAEAAEGSDPFYELNRSFGRMITKANEIPQVLVAVIEGAVLGGGFGLACISDVALAANTAKFGLPETGLGIPPAQIAPFVVNRIGLTQARKLALLGERFNGDRAVELGVVHQSYDSIEKLEEALKDTLEQVKKCAPQANRVTKKLILDVSKVELNQLLDGAAKSFSAAVQGKEGQEGTMAFVEKRKASWAES